MSIHNNCLELLEDYKLAPHVVEELWTEISDNYSKKDRHYHNLNHLNDIYEQLCALRSNIDNWSVVMFSLFYHDIIYAVTKSNNEEKSAELAAKRMTQIGVSKNNIEACIKQILATKSHISSDDPDTNYFTDADLSILGRDWETYQTYCQNIRKEYAIYPNLVYKKGRKKVVRHFLSMERIFKTDAFFEKFEERARTNLEQELRSL